MIEHLSITITDNKVPKHDGNNLLRRHRKDLQGFRQRPRHNCRYGMLLDGLPDSSGKARLHQGADYGCIECVRS